MKNLIYLILILLLYLLHFHVSTEFYKSNVDIALDIITTFEWRNLSERETFLLNEKYPFGKNLY